jgi:hypothetical protein
VRSVHPGTDTISTIGKLRWAGAVTGCSALSLVLSSCGSTLPAPAAPPVTVTVSSPAPQKPTPTAPSATTNSTAPISGPVTSAASPNGATTPAVVVPDGVGKNYQQAQDLWRGAGLHVAPAEDATGAHRLPVVDSNWLVLAQDPPAGSKVATGTFITASVKKFTDG